MYIKNNRNKLHMHGGAKWVLLDAGSISIASLSSYLHTTMFYSFSIYLSQNINGIICLEFDVVPIEFQILLFLCFFKNNFNYNDLV